MNQLSGAEIKNMENPNGEIEIIFTGKRPGEKIYEELLIDAKAEGTSHPLILRAKEKLIEPAVLWKIIKKLEDAIYKQEKKEVLFCLSELVPEWDPYIKEKDLSSSF